MTVRRGPTHRTGQRSVLGWPMMACSVGLVTLLEGCAPNVNACVTTYAGVDGAPPRLACRQDLRRTACASEGSGPVFTPGRSCSDVGYPCFRDGWGAVVSEARDASGACPSGTMAPK